MRTLLLVCLVVLSNNATASIVLPDSLISEEQVYERSVNSPDTALAIIQVMRERELLDDWHLDYMEANYYVNQRQFRIARKYYLSAVEKSKVQYLPRQQMQIMLRLIAVDDHLLNDDEMIKYAFRMERIAKDVHDDYFLHEARFLLAKHRHFQGDSTGLASCLEAVSNLQSYDIPYKCSMLFYCYSDLVRMYAIDEQYDEALRMSFLQEQCAKSLEPISKSQIDANALRKTYAMRACLYAMMGRMEEAAEVYRQWEQTPHAIPADDMLVLDYLIMVNRYDEAYQIINAYKKYLIHEGDSISHWMMYTLSQEYIVMDGTDNPQAASRLNSMMFNIAKELHKKCSKEMMDTTYAYLEQLEKSSQRYVLILYICIAVFVLIVLLTLFAIDTRKVRQRNKQLVSLVNGMEAYRYMLDKNEDSSTDSAEQCEQEGQPSEQETADPASVEDSTNPEDEEEAVQEALRRYRMSDDDKQLFVLMDRLVVRKMLFLKPDLNREDLMNLLGIDKNRFGKMMSHYCSANNASSYISAKRAEYAAVLLRQHPEFTIAAIAEMCGMNNTVTLNRTFKQLFGVTPSEYRSGFSGDTVGEKPKKQ